MGSQGGWVWRPFENCGEAHGVASIRDRPNGSGSYSSNRGVESEVAGEFLDFDRKLGTGATTEQVSHLGFLRRDAAADGVEISGQAGAVAAAIVAEEIVSEQRGGVVEIVGGLGASTCSCQFAPVRSINFGGADDPQGAAVRDRAAT